MSFLELIRKLRLQGKFPLKNLQWWDNPESNSQDLFTWNRTCWCHKMLRTLDFHTLLETEYGLIWECEPPRDSHSGEYIQGLYIQVPQQIFKLNFSRNGKKMNNHCDIGPEHFYVSKTYPPGMKFYQTLPTGSKNTLTLPFPFSLLVLSKGKNLYH